MGTIITAEMIQQLKQVNISVDGEKTKERVSALWKGAGKAEREAILSLSGLSKPSVERVYKTGSISLKLVIPIAQTLNISPYYLTGESDGLSECTDEQLAQLLMAHGYSDLLPEQPPEKVKRKPSASSKAKAVIKEEPAPELENPVEYVEQAIPANAISPSKDLSRFLEEAITPEKEAFIESMTEEDMILLMRAIMLRAKTGGESAELAKLLKLVLTL